MRHNYRGFQIVKRNDSYSIISDTSKKMYYDNTVAWFGTLKDAKRIIDMFVAGELANTRYYF